MKRGLSVILIILCLCSCSLLEKRIQYVKEREAKKLSSKSIEVLKREYYAILLMEECYKDGQSISITAIGSNKDILALRYVLFTPARVYQIVNAPKFKEVAEELGFTRVFFSNEGQWGSRYSNEWLYSLREKAFIEAEPMHRLYHK